VRGVRGVSAWGPPVGVKETGDALVTSGVKESVNDSSFIFLGVEISDLHFNGPSHVKVILEYIL
jgi:hypothetical protein